MYKNIIFDLGGVIVNFNPKDFLTTHFFNKKVERILYRSVFSSEQWLELDQGLISWYDACDIFLKRGKEEDIYFEMRGLLDNWTEMLTVKNETLVILQQLLKNNYNLYYLSNISFHALNALSKNYFWGAFKGGVASCEAGLIKPDPAIYKLLLKTYELDPNECAFIDNKEENAKSAAECGILGITFETPKKLKNSLTGLHIL